MSYFRFILFAFLTAGLSGCTNSIYSEASVEADNEVVVLVHGLGRSGLAMWRLGGRLENAGFDVCTLDYETVGQTVEAVMTATDTEIEACIPESGPVHFVGHSLGGLVVRHYLQQHPSLVEQQRLGEVILMGTPNKGSEVADQFDGNWAMDWAGEVSQSLVTGKTTLGESLQKPDYQPGVIAGTKSTLATDYLFAGENDGLVSVESAKVENMKDFIAIEVGHSAMRHSSEVARQTIYFLHNGEFIH